MTDELVFYTNPMSRGRTVRWMLEELAEPYDTVVLEYGGSMKAPAFLALNPMGKVPTLTHGTRVVTETAAICCYLADTFPEAELAPKASERADYYRWLFFCAGPLEQAFTNRAIYGDQQPPDSERMLGYGNFEAPLNALTGWLQEKTYLCGERFTAADVYVGMNLHFQLQFGNIPSSPTLTAYTKRLAEREAFVRATAIDEALITKAGT